MKKVKKRDGRIVDFDSSKIINAVLSWKTVKIFIRQPEPKVYQR